MRLVYFDSDFLSHGYQESSDRSLVLCLLSNSAGSLLYTVLFLNHFVNCSHNLLHRVSLDFLHVETKNRLSLSQL